MARGFALLSPEKRREISGKGGKAAHVKGTAHEFTVEEARIAGRKGGRATHGKRLGLGAANGVTPSAAPSENAAPTIPSNPPTEALGTIDAGANTQQVADDDLG
jgi:uncharacterized protein